LYPIDLKRQSFEISVFQQSRGILKFFHSTTSDFTACRAKVDVKNGKIILREIFGIDGFGVSKLRKLTMPNTRDDSC